MQNNRYTFQLIILIVALSEIGFMSFCCAQLPSIKLEHINSKNGLPTDAINVAMKDKNGFMWFGTRLCPIRYDGATFRSFRKPETNMVTGNHLSSIINKALGNCMTDQYPIWVITGGNYSA